MTHRCGKILHLSNETYLIKSIVMCIRIRTYLYDIEIMID